MKTKVLKKLCSFLLVLSMLTSTGIGQAVGELVGMSITVSATDTLTYGDYQYTVNDDNTVTITKYKGTDAEITIPSSINGKKVTKIGNSAFFDCHDLTNAIIPNGVTSIGDWAFFYCTELTNITVPDSVTSIGGWAFSDCTELTSIDIPNGVTCIENSTFHSCSGLTSITIPNGATSIEDSAFYGCSGLTSIAIPDSVALIGNMAFYECTGLTSITISNSVTSIGDNAFGKCANLINISVDSGNSTYSSEDGILFNKKKTKILVFPCTKKGTYVIPDSVTLIGDKAFCQCAGLTSITIPNSVTSIESCAFEGCKSLKNIEIPNSVTSIGGYTFRECTNLTSIVIPDGVKSIKNGTFDSCSNLTSITFPAGITSIGDYAFYDCFALTGIIIPDSTAFIGDGAFYGCLKLTSVTIPSSVTSIGNYVFGNCANLTSINVDDTHSIYSSKNGVLFNKKQTEIISCPCAKKGSYTIPDSVTSIGNYAFYDCYNFKSITIPDSVISIGDYAFRGCTNLTGITIPNSVTSIGDYAFYGCTNLASTTIPDGVTEIYGVFYDCLNLTSITIPDNVTEIGVNTFFNCDNLTIYGNEGSYAETYANANNIPFKDIVHCYNYTVNSDNTVTITEYGSLDTKITIPSVINGKNVTSIGDEAFYYCTNLISVTIPDSIISIGNRAFSNCFRLTDIKIPDSVTSIGESAFKLCTSLTSITIPDSVTSIGNHAFDDCNNLKICGNSDSYAATYAAENNIPFTAIEPTPEPKYISDMTITLTPTSFTYDGTAKKPAVTVEEEIEYLVYEIPPPTSSGTVASATLIIRTETEIKKLVEGTDYSLKYENNINAGTAKVTITGMNGYKGSVTKDFTINPKSIANAAITLNPTSYIYDGTAKKPAVTVKDGTKTLVSGTDYSVSYSDNVNAGTAKVTVTGKNNYTDTAKTTFLIKESSLQFQWGVDNWKFENSDDYIWNVPYSEKINSTYLNVLKKNLSYSEYMKIFWGEGRSPALLYTTNGTCYGMSAVTLLAKYGFMDFGSYQTNAEKLYDLDAPIKHSLSYLSNKNNVSSLITYYQMLQVKDAIQQKCRKVSNRSNKTNIQEILALLDKNAVVLVGYQWGTEKNSFAHAVLAYGYGYSNNTFNGVTYDGYIKIYDPNCSHNDTGVYIYFNKSTYHWIIPGKNLSSSGYPSVKFSCIDADTDDINDGGYLGSNTSGSDSDKFIARIDAPVISKERFVSKMTQSGGTYMNNDDGKNDIIEDYSYILNGNANGIFGYNLYDPDSAYEVSQKTAANLELHMDYEDCDLYGYSSLGKSVIFDKKGFVNIEGETGDYEMAMTFDSNYPTDWFYINVAGTGASDVSLLKEKNGYVLSGDNLNKIQICTKNMTDSASIGFSTDYKKVFIYEIDKNTIGLKVDKDNNDTYETSIKGVPILENNSYLSSDSIQLGSAVTVIASGKGGEGDLQYAVYYKKQSESKWTAAQDYNANTTVSITPANVTDYDICVKVKDKNGNIEKKYFVVSVYDVLKNTSTVSAMQINLGSAVSVQCSATGGTGSYKYAVYYKQQSQSKWTVKQDFSKNTSVSVKPGNAVDYDICVKVKDSSGTVEKKYFAVKVFDILKNTSTISATQINLGSTVSVKCSATDGTGNYTYSVLYKQKSQSKWTVAQDFGKNAVVSVKPGNSADYDICVKVKDSSGTVEKKYFEVTVR